MCWSFNARLSSLQKNLLVLEIPSVAPWSLRTHDLRAQPCSEQLLLMRSPRKAHVGALGVLGHVHLLLWGMVSHVHREDKANSNFMFLTCHM